MYQNHNEIAHKTFEAEREYSRTLEAFGEVADKVIDNMQDKAGNNVQWLEEFLPKE